MIDSNALPMRKLLRQSYPHPRPASFISINNGSGALLVFRLQLEKNENDEALGLSANRMGLRRASLSISTCVSGLPSLQKSS